MTWAPAEPLPGPAARKWFFYGLGGGMGHLTRALALARVALQRGHQASLLTNSPYLPWLPLSRELWPGLKRIHIPPESPGASVARQVLHALRSRPFDVLVVDTFPRGLAGELAALLPELTCARILVHRDLNPRYVERFHVAECVPHYDKIIVPGEAGPLSDSPNAVATAPWLLLDPEGLASREEARRELGAAEEDRPLVVFMGCGEDHEARSMQALAARARRQLKDSASVRFVSMIPALAVSAEVPALPLWPLLRLLPGIDVLVGSGGYNTVNECRQTRTPLVALAQPRLYDRQILRLQPEERAAHGEEAIDKVVQCLDRQTFPPSKAPPSYCNGVHQALQWIETEISPPGNFRAPPDPIPPG